MNQIYNIETEFDNTLNIENDVEDSLCIEDMEESLCIEDMEESLCIEDYDNPQTIDIVC